MAKQVEIVPTQVFLHGRDRYEPGETYTVSPDEAAYFRANGWVEGGPLSVSGDQDVTLDIQSMHVATAAEEAN